MKIGITYDLKDDYLALGFDKEACAEFDSAETIDAIDHAIKANGHSTERIGNIFALTKALTQGKRWDLVFNICEGMHGRGREAQVPALLDAFQIPYVFSDTSILALTLDKALTKHVLRDMGVATADFALLANADACESVLLPYPLFVKPVAEGTSKGISAQSLVHDKKELHAVVEDLTTRFAQPALAETYLAGREFTVGITGTGASAKAIGVLEIELLKSADACGYTYENKMQYEQRVRYHLADDMEAKKSAQVALSAWRTLGCRDGGRVDMRSDAHGNPHVIEVNPLAGLHPVLGDLVILSRLIDLPYQALIGRMIDSALHDNARFPTTKAVQPKKPAKKTNYA